MSRVGVVGGTSSYFRLSTRPMDPAAANLPDDPGLLERRRRDHAGVVSAADLLAAHGVTAGVLCVMSPDLV